MSHVALPDWLDFRPRLFPSCNFVWLAGRTPVLVDSGFGSDLGATLEMLPGDPALLFNTHWHSDHVGGNAELGSWYGMPIAASAAEGTRVNAGDPEAFGSDWLDQPVDLHGVDRLLEPGELVETGSVRGLHPYLVARRWVRDFSSSAGMPPEDFAERVVRDLTGSGAARWEQDRLVSTVPHTRVPFTRPCCQSISSGSSSRLSALSCSSSSTSRTSLGRRSSRFIRSNWSIDATLIRLPAAVTTSTASFTTSW